MILLDRDTKYNNFIAEPAVYAAGQPLLLGVQLQAQSNNEPTYISIQSNDTGELITTLELCRVGNNCFIDVSPFLLSFMTFNEELATITDQYPIYYFTIVCRNYGDSETTGGHSITINFFAYKRSLQRGVTPMIAGNSAFDQMLDWPEGVREGDFTLNDQSPLYFPNIASRYSIPAVMVNSDEYISLNTASGVRYSGNITIYKRIGRNNIPLFQRECREIRYCGESSVVVRYLNNYDYFEYFIFDSHRETSFEIEKGNRMYDGITNNVSKNLGNIYSTDITESITAYTTINDDDYYNKFLDLIKSRKVYIYRPNLVDDSFTNNANWLECDMETTPQFYSKKRVNKVSCKFEIKNTQLC